MLQYERVDADLFQAEKTIRSALRSECDTDDEKEALREALELVERARETCRLAQKEMLEKIITQSM